jgi:hypothetical protein
MEVCIARAPETGAIPRTQQEPTAKSWRLFRLPPNAHD